MNKNRDRGVEEALLALRLIGDGDSTVELFHATSMANAHAIKASASMAFDRIGVIYLSTSRDIANVHSTGHDDISVITILRLRAPIEDLFISRDWRSHGYDRLDLTVLGAPDGVYPVVGIGCEPYAREGDPRERLRRRLDQLIQSLGLSLSYWSPDTPEGRLGWMGFYSPESASIGVAEGLSPEEELMVLVHELCHALRHPTSAPNVERSEAESLREEQIVHHAAASVCAAYDLGNYRERTVFRGVPASAYPETLPDQDAETASAELAESFLVAAAALEAPQ